MKKFFNLVVVIIALWLLWVKVFSLPEEVIFEGELDSPSEAEISSGEKVKLKDHLVPGRYTVFVFYADW